MSGGVISPRMTELLRLAAVSLRAGISPLDHGFLAEHEVTLDEAYVLADWMAAGVDALLELDRSTPGRRMIGVAVASAALGGAS
ncbi:MAG: hypothetical protein AVDCRST_MAG68-5109 [uncultured Gemmatimonadetes bacterium]|uniref:Uncharacterized protein n=1 Tax=uncultured Gemmatimonadota bacterium TaxID=203437 RepID=A0A6J4MPC3_9BACT|nr:MAG: hypothetical protein AVDCRST_MAG68-5109 [uncultured Gemmatimonadota bacterium]